MPTATAAVSPVSGILNLAPVKIQETGSADSFLALLDVAGGAPAGNQEGVPAANMDSPAPATQTLPSDKSTAGNASVQPQLPSAPRGATARHTHTDAPTAN